MNTRVDKIIESINYKEFSTELLKKIFEMGIGTYSKNDMYDYILYVANKHSSERFLDKQTNYDNAVLLKVTETKIKNTKLNISLKYKNETEKNKLFEDFLFKIPNSSCKCNEYLIEPVIKIV